MVGETNSVVGYHLLTKGHSIQLGSGGLIITIILIINNNIFRVSSKITIKSQPQVPYKVVP